MMKKISLTGLLVLFFLSGCTTPNIKIPQHSPTHTSHTSSPNNNATYEVIRSSNEVKK